MNEVLARYEFICIGSATVDQFAKTDSELIKIQTRTTTEELIAFPLGSKLLISELNITTGGGGTNSAVALARLGLKTAFLGKLGDDVNAKFVMQALCNEGVDFIGGCEGQTGVSMILDSIADDRTILAFKGANNNLMPQDVKPFKTQWVYLSSMLEQSFDTVVDLLQAQQCNVAFNPSNYQAKMGYEALSALIEQVDVLIMNKEEASIFLGLRYEEQPETRELMKEMSKLPPSVFVITDGARGVMVYDRKYCYTGEPMDIIDIAETTGAGDAFASTFAAAQYIGLSPDQAIHMAMTNAESVIQYRGAKEKLLDRQALENVMRLRDRKISKTILN
jgi:ribokinase